MSYIAKKLAPMLSVAVLVGAPLASAGAQYESAYCSKAEDGSGYCYGNFLGFRNSSATTTYAYFSLSDGSKSFSASTKNSITGVISYYSCQPSGNVGAMWSKAVAHTGYFYVTWDTGGTCNYLYLNNSSQYANF